MKNDILQKIMSRWEHTLCVSGFLALLLLCIATALCCRDNASEEDNRDTVLKATTIFPWFEAPFPYDDTSIPEAEHANPFSYTLTSLLPRESEKKAPETAKAEPEKKTPEQPEKKQDKPAEPPKPPEKHWLTIAYRGLFVTRSGEKIALVTMQKSKEKSPSQLLVHIGEAFGKRFTAAEITEDQLTLQTTDGQLKSIPWNDHWDCPMDE